MQRAILVKPPQILAPIIQRHRHDDRKHGDGELNHVYSHKSIGGGDIEHPVGERKAELEKNPHISKRATMARRRWGSKEKGRQKRTVFFKIVATIIISPLIGLKQSIAYAIAIVGTVVTLRPEKPYPATRMAGQGQCCCVPSPPTTCRTTVMRANGRRAGRRNSASRMPLLRTVRRFAMSELGGRVSTFKLCFSWKEGERTI